MQQCGSRLVSPRPMRQMKLGYGRGCTDTQEIALVCDTGARPVCGNGRVEAGEACDDGNRTAGDGCASDCTIEEPDPNDSVLCPPDLSGALTRCTCENCSAEIDAAENGAGAELAIDLIECQRTSGCHGLFCLCGEAGNVECFGGELRSAPFRG